MEQQQVMTTSEVVSLSSPPDVSSPKDKECSNIRDSVVYDEIPECVLNHSLPTATAKAQSANEIQLVTNSAYHRAMYKSN